MAAWAARQGVWVHRIIRFLDVVELTLLALHLSDSELQKLDMVAVCTQRAKISCRETCSQSKTWFGWLQPATHIHDFFSVQTRDRTTPVLRPGRDLKTGSRQDRSHAAAEKSEQKQVYAAQPSHGSFKLRHSSGVYSLAMVPASSFSLLLSLPPEPTHCSSPLFRIRKLKKAFLLLPEHPFKSQRSVKLFRSSLTGT